MKQLRNVSKVLVVLCLLIGTSSLFIGCSQLKSNSNSTKTDNESILLTITGMDDNIKMTCKNFNKNKRSFDASTTDRDGNPNYCTFTITFNENFTKFKLTNFIDDGEMYNDNDLSEQIIGSDGIWDYSGEIDKFNLTPVINELK